MKERLLYIFLLAALPLSLHAERFDYRSAAYNRLEAMPGGKLLDLAYSYLDDEEKRDSAEITIYISSIDKPFSCTSLYFPKLPRMESYLSCST